MTVLRLCRGSTKNFTLESLRDAAYDNYLTAFDELLPPLFKAYDEASVTHPLKARLAEQIELLRGWDRRWSTTSVPTALAIFWGAELVLEIHRCSAPGGRVIHLVLEPAAEL